MACRISTVFFTSGVVNKIMVDFTIDGVLNLMKHHSNYLLERFLRWLTELIYLTRAGQCQEHGKILYKR